MSTRKVMDAKNLDTGEEIYFTSHAQATFLSDGTTVENNLNDIRTNMVSKEYVDEIIQRYIIEVLNTPV